MADLEILKSYLVDLGFEVNQPQLRKFDLALKDAAGMVESRTSGLVKEAVKWQTAIVGVFTAISGGVVAMADQVAAADQQYRLFGLRMFMTQESARKLQIGMKALGASLEEIAWDPELNKRFLQLADDQDRLQQKLGVNFKENMRAIRDLRFEFTRLEVKLQYFAMAFVSRLFERMGTSVAGVESKLEELGAWFEDHIPEIADQVGDVLVPVLQDTWEIVKGLGAALAAVAEAFEDVVGALTGDAAITNADNSMSKLKATVLDLTHFLLACANAFNFTLEAAAHFVSGVARMTHGDWKGANDEGNKMDEALRRPLVPPQSQPGAEPQQSRGPVSDLITKTAQAFGVDPRLAHGVAMQESGERQFDQNGNVIANPASSARGVFQLLKGTAAGLGVDRNDTGQNIAGGVRMLADLLKKYGGSEDKAVAAYYWGSGNLDRAIARHQELPPEVLNYVRGVRGYEGQQVTVGDISISIMQPNASPEDIQRAATQGVAEALRRQTTRNQAQLAYVG